MALTTACTDSPSKLKVASPVASIAGGGADATRWLMTWPVPRRICGRGPASLAASGSLLTPPPTAAVELAVPALRWCARFALGVFRSVPEIVWAYVFVRLLGLGPGAAVLAIALTVGGNIGKLFAELAEAVDPRAVQALRATGQSPHRVARVNSG